MGTIAHTMRLQTLIQYKNQLEMNIQSATEERLALQSQANELVSIGYDLDPDSETLKELKVKQERLNLIEKQLESKIAKWQASLQAVENEVQHCRHALAKDIEGAYSYTLSR